MQHARPTNERGQTLVFVALLMVGLLAASGLAIDGGTMLLERRRMQNAADAAAMAGARDLVMGKVGELERDDDDILETVRHFAETNGVLDPEANLIAEYVDQDNAVLGTVGAGAIPDAATGISATVRIERAAHFMQVVGIHTVPASAFSLAQTGPPDQAAWLRPVGLPEAVFDDLQGSGGRVRIHFGNPNQCDPENEAVNVCLVFWDTEEGEQRSYAHRGWWNYNEICGAEETAGVCSATGGASIDEGLQGWMKSGYPGSVKVGDRVCSKPGTNNAVLDPRNVSEGDTFCIPVYTSIGSTDLRYDVAGFTRVEITQVKRQGNDPYLEMELTDGECVDAYQTEAGEPAYNVYAVSQWE